MLFPVFSARPAAGLFLRRPAVPRSAKALSRNAAGEAALRPVEQVAAAVFQIPASGALHTPGASVSRLRICDPYPARRARSHPSELRKGRPRCRPAQPGRARCRRNGPGPAGRERQRARKRPALPAVRASLAVPASDATGRRPGSGHPCAVGRPGTGRSAIRARPRRHM